MLSIAKSAKTYLNAFKAKNNCNTGNIYEIMTAFQNFRNMGLTDNDFEELSEDLVYLENLGHGNSGISKAIAHIKKMPVGLGAIFNGKKIVDITNLTQEDGVGTADLEFTYDDGTKEGVSITEGDGKIKKSGLSKVITNAGVQRMGCTKEDIDKIIDLENLLTKEDKEKFCSEKFGTDKKLWKKKCKYPPGIKVQADCAALIGDRMASLAEQKRRDTMNDILCISKMPADYIAFVNKKTFKIVYYKICGTVIDKDAWIPEIKVNGVYLETYCGDTIISKSQVKYNNGVGTSMRKVNIGAILNKLFKLELV